MVEESARSKRFGLFDPNDEEIAGLIPANAKRVKVQDIDGQEKWRDPAKFEVGDKIIIENGEPRSMFRVPGRKSKQEEVEEILPQATTEEAKKRAQLKREFLERDELIQLAKENPDDEKVLSFILEGLAEESASLSFERAQKESRNQETSQISLRRVNSLKAMAEIYLKKKEQASSRIIDLKSPEFAILFGYLVSTFKECMTNASIDDDAINVVMDNFMTEVRQDSWAALAVRKMKGEV